MFPAFTALVTCFIILLCFLTTFKVGQARGRYKIEPPAVNGHPDFDRVFRVQQNTLEQTLIFLPVLWLFGFMISDMGAALVGTVWLIGRVIYALSYYADAKKRLPGFIIALLATVIAWCGSIYGAISLILMRG